MLQRTKQRFSSIHLKRLLLISALTSLATLLAVIVFIAYMPTILSADAAQTYIRSSLSKSLKRQVTWARLNISWSRGLDLKGFALGPGPAPLLTLSMDEMTLLPDIGFKNGRLRVDLALRCRTISAEAAPGPPAPPKPYKEPLTAIAEGLQKFERMDWPLPLDLGVTIAVEPVNLAYRDPKSGRSLKLGDLAFRFAMPSLADKPIITELHGKLSVDGHPFEELSFSGDLRHLVSTARHIHPAAAEVSFKADLPGTSLTIKGGLQEPEGVAVKARLDLPRIMAAAGPFLTTTTPKVSGEMLLDLKARVDTEQNLHAGLELVGSRVALSGGRLRQGRVGPLDLNLQQKIVSDRQKQQVRFTEGSARFGRFLEAAWEATVDRPSGKDRDLTARLGPVRVDLKKALEAAGPLLPKDFPVREMTGEVTLQQLSAKLSGRKNRGEIKLEKLAMTVPRLRVVLAKGGVIVDGVDLSIDRATVPLESRKPTRVDAALSYAVQRCTLSGAQPLVAEGLKGGLQLTITDLDLKSKSPRKVTANVDLKQSLDLGRVSVDKKLSIATLHQQLTALITAKESGVIEVTLPELKVSAAAVQATASGKQLKPLPLTAVVNASGIRLSAAKGAQLVIERAACTISGGDFLQLSATGALLAGTPQLAVTDGTVRLDLDRILPLAAPFLPKGAAAGGSASLSWSLAAPTVQPPLPKNKNPLVGARAAATMVDRAGISVELNSRAISWPLKSGLMTLADLHTSKPLRIVLPGRSGKITLEGAFAFAGLGGLSGASGKLPAQSGSLAFSGELADWQSLKLHEELRAEPFGVVQKADATISRIGMLLEKPETITAAVLLQKLDAVVTADIEARFPSLPTPVPGGAELSGESRAGVRLDLAAGRDLKVRATAATRDFGVRMANATKVEGVNADILIDRTYLLAKGEAVDWSPLSVSLVHPLPESFSAAGTTEIISRVREDLRGQGSGSRKFSIRKLVTRSGDTTLELTSLEGDLLLTPEEMGLGFFQGELLGGTIRLRSMIDLKPEIPSVSAACSFTNLETFLLLSPDIRNKSTKTDQDTGITGEISFDAPLQTGQRELLEGFRMRLNLRKIGANTLERALFGLDPNERNEQIVAQRKQLRYGTLQVLRAGTLDGAFSLDGEVKVKGVTISLPKVERLRLSELPIQKQMARALAGITSFRKLLDLARADTLIVGAKGKVELVRRGHE